MKRTLASAMALAVALAISALPADAADSEAEVLDRELVVYDLTSGGKVTKATLLDSLTVLGDGRLSVEDRGDGLDLRNLYGSEIPTTRAGKITWDFDVDHSKEVITSSTISGEGPVRIRPRYFLDGRAVTANQLLGKTGEVAIEYAVRNNTAKTEILEFISESGETIRGPVETYVPLVGQVEFVLPADKWTNVAAPGGHVTTDEANVHHITFSLILSPIIGSTSMTVRIEGIVKDFEMDTTQAVFLPVLPGGVTERAEGTSASLQELFAGVGEVDANLIKLYEGTQELVAGLTELNAGIVEARRGVGAVGEEETIVDGLKRVRDGLSLLGDSSEGLPAAKAGVDTLAAGVEEILTGLGAPGTPGTVLFGLSGLDAGLDSLEESATGALTTIKGGIDATSAGVGTIAGGIGAANAVVGVAPGVPVAPAPATSIANDIESLLAANGCPAATINCAVLAGIKAKTAGVNAGLTTAIGGLTGGVIPSLGALSTGASDLSAGISAGVGTPASGADTLRGGLAAVTGGLEAIKAGLSSGDASDPKILEGLEAVSSGLTEAIAGIGAIGADDTLIDGTNQLFLGSQDLAAGLELMDDGSLTARDGATTIAEGQLALSERGTKEIQSGVGSGVLEASTAVALLEAMQARALNDGFVGGTPDEAFGMATYVYQIAGITREALLTATHFIIAAILLAALVGWGVIAVRRQGPTPAIASA